MNLADRLAQYALEVEFSDLDPMTLLATKARIVDALGCAIGAMNEGPVKIARKVVGGLSSARSSTLLGTKSRSSPELSTFVNGFMVRYFDFNDTYLSKEPAHPSDNLAPCLAVAESEKASGKDLLTALVVAYEIQCRLADAADIRHRGWDHVNYGLVSTSLASSKLMGLSMERATNSVNIALNSHIAMRQVRAGELSMWKGASFANAARNGVFAAMLAREGMTGPSPIFEGEMGFFEQVSGRFSLDVDGFGGRKGTFKVGDTYVKYWPAEYHAQTAIWAALEVRKKMKPEDAESVTVETHEAGYTILAKDKEKWRPKTKETADHSLPFIVGMAILKGTVDESTYAPSALRDPRILSLVRKVTVREDPELTAMYPAKGMGNRITMESEGGKKVSAEVLVPLGHPLRPMSRDDIEGKFKRLTSGKIAASQGRRALRSLWALESQQDLGSLLAELQVC